MIKLVPFANQKNITIESLVNINSDFLSINYIVSGALSNITFDQFASNQERRWELWHKSCFELFIKHPDKKEYLEFNFSTGNEWNCFYLQDYRVNEGEYNKITSVDLSVSSFSSNMITLTAKIRLNDIPLFSYKQLISKEMRFGITAITKFNNNELEYWAIKHCKGKPDFHHLETFSTL